MLKAWIQNEDVGEIEVEEKYRSWVHNLRTDRYATVEGSGVQQHFSRLDYRNWILKCH